METEKKKLGKKEKINYPMMAFFFIVTLIVGIGIGYYIATPKESIKTTTTTTISVIGGEVVKVGKIVKVDYIGKFENSTVFDTSLEEEAKKAGIYMKGRIYAPFSFTVGKGQVIEGFDEAVIGMKVGEEKEFTIPPEKGYSSGPLAGKTLIFKIWIREIKEPVKVELTVLNDKNCKECDTSRILTITKNLFSAVQVREVDSNSDEGKKLIEKYNILLLPAYLFSENVAEAENYDRNSEVFEKVNDRYILKPDVTGATYYVSEEAKKKVEEKICKEVEPKVDKPNLKVFYMSYCPYGIQAVERVAPVAALLKNKVEIEPHFVIYANYGGGGPDYCIENGTLCSMHGINELKEDIRQACIFKYEKEKFWNYTLCAMTDCSLSNIETCWKTCTEKFNVDTKKIEKCQKDEGATLMKKEKELNEKYDARGSPTIVLNEKSYTGGRSSEDFKTYICCSFKQKPKECDTKLSGVATATSSGGCGG